MKISQKKLLQSQIELEVEIPLEELKPFLAQAASKISKEQKIPGFRPGKVPLEVLEKKVGKQSFWQEAAQLAVQKTYPQVILEHKLEVLAKPKIELVKIAPGNPLIYKATVTVLPKVKLSDYKKVRVKRKKVEVKKEEVEKVLKNLQKMYGKEKLVLRKAQRGDKVEVDFETFLDKVPVAGGKSQSHPIILSEGHFVPGFENNLMGLAQNEIKEFTLKFPPDHPQKNLAGRLVEFRVKVKSVYQIELPELNDEFAKTAGNFSDFEALKKHIFKNLEEEAKFKEKQRLEGEILDRLMAQTEFEELPEILIESEKKKMVEELEQDLKRQGMVLEKFLANIKKTRQQLQEEFTPKAKKRIQGALIARKIAEQEQIGVDEQEIERELKKLQEIYKDNEAVQNQLKTPEYRQYLRHVLVNRKVFDLLEKLATQ